MEQLILVNEQDEQIGTADKMTVHRNALCHRAFSVFIFRKKNGILETLLQQRQLNKYHCGGLWTNTCCSHPRPGETSQAGAERRLYEEMGLRFTLHHQGKFHYIAQFDNGLTENEVDHVFIAEYDDQLIQPNPVEVEKCEWVSVDALKKAFKQYPEQYTPWLNQALTIALKEQK